MALPFVAPACLLVTAVAVIYTHYQGLAVVHDSGATAGIIAAAWLRGEHRMLDTVAIGLLTACAVFMLRKSANMPQLNNDGLQGFSAKDWVAPTVTFVVLGIYGAVRPATESRRFEQARAAATVVAFAINVVTI